ncbi:3-hydroxyacyl-CoA dehydrogenase NAD-binding domain-containing protein [Acidocella sp.]|uniref:3-hydroxyacyl-CoA dehydrogenase NAD-binding domain-containing protein n=1 Tax=Acidocella sp. TaxID=50710 RepID=UPI003CFDB2D0
MAHAVSLRVEAGVGIITIDNPPVNVMSLEVRLQLQACLEAARRQELKGILLTGAGRVFMAGADLTELARGVLPPPPDPNELHEMIESSPVPVAVALHGTCLGGGTEMALACHFRLAAREARLGLPEVTLGLLPGAGGTQRLPRLLPAGEALNFMLTGAPVTAEWAHRHGLVDELFVGDPVAAGLAFFASPRAPRRTADRPARLPETGLPPAAPDETKAQARIRACVEAAGALPFAEGLALERRLFMDCLESPEAKALLHLFFAERECAKIPGLPANVTPRSFARIGVVGAGTMGSGIAMACANAGLPVTLLETDEAALTRGLSTIAKTYETMVARGRLAPEHAARRQALVAGTLDRAALGECDIVIEAVFESMAVKRQVMEMLGRVCRPGAIIATNTSTLDVNVLAEASGRPADVLGLHFFSPAQIMRLLEVVRGTATAPDALATGLAFARKIGKIAVVSGVCYGFIGNRMLEGYLREAEALLLEGATPAQVDAALEAFGMAMGPFRMMDMAGVDLGDRLVREAQEAGHVPGGPAYRAMTKALAAQGRFGQKSGAGYYRHEGRNALADEDVVGLAAELAAKMGIARHAAFSTADIQRRCLAPLVQEGAKLLEEGIACRASDIDMVWAAGYGFPRREGGPMFWGRAQGLLTATDHSAA